MMTDILSFGYKKYKDEDIEEKNGYSLSFEDLQLDTNTELEEADICNLSDDWTPIGSIKKKMKKSFSERMCRYIIWMFSLSGMTAICYYTIIELYRE